MKRMNTKKVRGPFRVKTKNGAEYKVSVVGELSNEALEAFYNAYFELCIKQFEKELVEKSNNNPEKNKGE